MIQLLTGIQNTSAALDAERTRLDVISQNIANAHTTHDVDGKPYQRRVVVFETALQNAMNGQSASANLPAIQVAKIERDTRPPLLIPDPGNPEADANGNVAVPNINIHEEMADLISASRTFEANLAVVKNARSMAMATLAIGRH
jgi:flagellar basal-body rod protein FlgC